VGRLATVCRILEGSRLLSLADGLGREDVAVGDGRHGFDCPSPSELDAVECLRVYDPLGHAEHDDRNRPQSPRQVRGVSGAASRFRSTRRSIHRSGRELAVQARFVGSPDAAVTRPQIVSELHRHAGRQALTRSGSVACCHVISKDHLRLQRV
jgi:hypothetical protein